MSENAKDLWAIIMKKDCSVAFVDNKDFDYKSMKLLERCVTNRLKEKLRYWHTVVSYQSIKNKNRRDEDVFPYHYINIKDNRKAYSRTPLPETIQDYKDWKRVIS